MQLRSWAGSCENYILNIQNLAVKTDQNMMYLTEKYMLYGYSWGGQIACLEEFGYGIDWLSDDELANQIKRFER